MLRTIAVITAAAVAGAWMAGARLGEPLSAATSETPTASATAAAASGNLLVRKARKLPVRAENRTGYDRDLFAHWTDDDGDGCDTRREVIIAEATTPVTVGSGCYITGGTFVSVYDNTTTRGYPANFDVDHLVPLAEAWDSGAATWTAQRRQAFANDLTHPASLILVTATSNRAKSDSDPAEWMPPNRDAWCGYLADWVTVKTRWGLSVDRNERRFLITNLRDCPKDSTLTTSGVTAGR